MIHYLKGDATDPIFTGQHRFILHICNSVGGWGRGFVLALSRRWAGPEQCYRAWARTTDGSFRLGEIQTVPVQPDLTVINMIAQEGYGNGNKAAHQSSAPNTTPPIRYEALQQCVQKAALEILHCSGTAHMPRIGTGLAGGSWDEIEPILERALRGVVVYVYDL